MGKSIARIMFLVILNVFVFGCDSNIIGISSLDSSKGLMYNQLPIQVQGVFAGTSSTLNKGEQIPVVNLDSAKTFLLETKETGPWVDYHILVNTL
ncbi:MAG: hypothetical protein AAGA86_10585, partial [Bacteroidota bacterium]